MCDFCGRTPCRSGCPNTKPTVQCICGYCSEPIYKGCEYYDFNGDYVCEDCIHDYISDFKVYVPEDEPYERDWDAIIKAEKEEADIKEREHGKL